MSYEPGTYAKGDDVKVATTPAKAVALVFQGYKLKSEKVDEAAAPAAPVTDTAPVQDEAPKALSAKPTPPKQKD